MPSQALLHEAQQLKEVSGRLWQTNTPQSRMRFSQSAERSAALPRFWKCSLLGWRPAHLNVGVSNLATSVIDRFNSAHKPSELFRHRWRKSELELGLEYLCVGLTGVSAITYSNPPLRPVPRSQFVFEVRPHDRLMKMQLAATGLPATQKVLRPLA